MDDGQGTAGSLPPFLAKTYEMVDDHSSDSIVSWSHNSKSFIVWNPPEFSRDLLPKFFKHNNFSSFIRQLNTYGFRKIDPEQWEFANDDFVRGQPQLMKNIHRRKPVHSHSMQNLQGQVAPLSESERQSLKDDIERLKSEKEQLSLELSGHEQERKGFELQMQVLNERLQKMEHKQQTMISSVAELLKESGRVLNLAPQLKNKKRRLPRIGYVYDEVSIEDNNQVGSSGTLSRENADAMLLPNIELLEQLESSLGFWANVIRSAGQGGQRITRLNSILEVDESTSCEESPAASSIELNVDPKSPGIDMNSEPVPVITPPEPVPSKEQAAATTAPTTTGVNDMFWEQFLTENPGSGDPQEVQTERKDSDSKKNENKAAENGRFWWNMRNVNNLADHMGQLTPAEKT